MYSMQCTMINSLARDTGAKIDTFFHRRNSMPNIRGGKGYKSGKEKSKLGEKEEVEFIEVQPDQMVGRLVRILGDLNAMIYCQDNKQRICKICRSVKKSVRFEIGDIVLVSLRDCEVPREEFANGVRGSRGDILDKFHPYQFSELKKTIDPRVFGKIETVSEISKLVGEGKDAEAEKVAAGAADDDDLFDRDAEATSAGAQAAQGAEEETESEDTETEVNVKPKKEKIIVEKKNKVNHRAAAVKQEEEVNFDDL
jgi:translation initiation factor IF-1